MSPLASFLTAAVPPLRWLIFALALANLSWSLRGAFAAVRGNLSAECGFCIAWSALLIGVIGFQTGYLFERVPSIPHWRHAVNLAIVVVALLLAYGAHLIRSIEIEERTGRASWELRLLRRLLR